MNFLGTPSPLNTYFNIYREESGGFSYETYCDDNKNRGGERATFTVPTGGICYLVFTGYNPNQTDLYDKT